MKEKRTNVARKKGIICFMLTVVLTMLFATTVSARDYDFDDIVSSGDPVFVKHGDIIHWDHEEGDPELRIRYEVSATSNAIIPGTKSFYKSRPHVVGEHEYNGELIDVWRVKRATYDADDFNLILIPGGGTANYTGYLHNWTLLSEEPCKITIKNSVEPGNCYANFENCTRKHKVAIDYGTDREKLLDYDNDEYNYYSGSLVLEIDRKIIHGLSEGKHTVTVFFADGHCDVNFVKGLDEAHAAGSQPATAATQTSQQNAAQDGRKKAPKTGEI